MMGNIFAIIICFIIAAGLLYFFYDIVIKGNHDGNGDSTRADNCGGFYDWFS